MTDILPQWHNYDQGLLCRLGQDISGKESEPFLDLLSNELGVDLFDLGPGFKAVHTPFTFLEAIGITSFPDVANEIRDAVLDDFKAVLPEIKAGRKSITELPMIVVKHYQRLFLHKNEVAVSTLVSRARGQMGNMQNLILTELLKHTIQYAIDDLDDPTRSKRYHRLVCNYLSAEFTQKFPYYDFLAKFFSEPDRKIKTQEIYHAFFQWAEDAIKQQFNISYFRSFDRARNAFTLWADGESRKRKETFVDLYRKGKAYLKNNEDYLDSYLIHFAICGFFFEGQSHKVHSFTLDSPDVIRSRLTYGVQMLQWIKECKQHSFAPNPGTVYCFDKASLTLLDKIEVGQIRVTPIPIGNTP